MVRQLIADGAIGEVTSVHFEWLLDTAHGADYFRRWHRLKDVSGGLLVHKSTHHFDLVNWWLADVPTRVYASGGLKFYGRANADARGLGERTPLSRDNDLDDPFRLDMAADPLLKSLYLDAESVDGYQRDLDVFNDSITIEDSLNLIVDYARGATMSYSLSAFGPWEGYRVAFNGTEGRIELDVVERGHLAVGERQEGCRSSTRPPSTTPPGPTRCDRSASGCCCSGTGRRPRRSRSRPASAATAAVTRCCSTTCSAVRPTTRWVARRATWTASAA